MGALSQMCTLYDDNLAGLLIAGKRRNTKKKKNIWNWINNENVDVVRVRLAILDYETASQFTIHQANGIFRNEQLSDFTLNRIEIRLIFCASSTLYLD